MTIQIGNMTFVFANSVNCANFIGCISSAKYASSTYTLSKVFPSFAISIGSKGRVGILLSLFLLLIKELLLFFLFLSLFVRSFATFKA